MLAPVVLALIAAALIAYVAAPLLRSDAAEAEKLAAAQSESVDLHSRHAMLLASLADLEEDRATGKLSSADYSEMQEQMTAEAIDLMKRMDALESRPAPRPGPRAVERSTGGTDHSTS